MARTISQRRAKAKQVDHSIAARWKHPELNDKGFLIVPTRVLELYSRLNPALTTVEAMFVFQVMSFKWSKDAPFPGYARLAERMGVGDKAVRKIAQALEAKGYLKRVQRAGRSNLFDLDPLFDALLELRNLDPVDGDWPAELEEDDGIPF